MGNMVQSNSIGAAFNNAFHVPETGSGNLCGSDCQYHLHWWNQENRKLYRKDRSDYGTVIHYRLPCDPGDASSGVGTAFKDIFVGAFCTTGNRRRCTWCNGSESDAFRCCERTFLQRSRYGFHTTCTCNSGG